MPPVQASGFHANVKSSQSAFVYLKAGVTHVRVLPAYNDKGVWFREIKEIPWHAEDGSYKPLVSPATLNRRCPFVEEGKRLYALGGEENVKKAKEFRPRLSYLFNVVVKGLPEGEVPIEECVKVLKCGVKVMRGILDFDQDVAGGWGDITNLEKGYDLRITRKGQGQMDTEYIVKGVQGQNNILEWLNEKGFTQVLTPQNLDDFFPVPSYEEMLPFFQQKMDADPSKVFEFEQGVGPTPVAPIVSQNTQAAPPLPERS